MWTLIILEGFFLVLVASRVDLFCPPKICSPVFKPVCGSDGKTYRNKCDFEKTNCYNRIHILHEGKCSADKDCQPSFCTKEYNSPVCGSDGKTYTNECVFDKANCQSGNVLYIRHDGNCNDECHFGKCSKQPEPVCSSDGKTYHNKCVFTYANCKFEHQILHKGECTLHTTCPHKDCSSFYDPVCGSDGETYHNRCEFDAANCRKDKKIKHKGECQEIHTEDTSKECPTVYCRYPLDPVCGSDGKTYDNKCEFKGANCRKDKHIVHEGRCQEDSSNKCPTVYCPYILEPVCGSDGKTYDSECDFKGANCRKDKHIVHEGRCEDDTLNECPPVEVCPYVTAFPVCGSDGKTYDSICVFDGANCRKDKHIVHHGRCGEDSSKECPLVACAKIRRPVCGSDGITYDNECEFNGANCRKDKHIVHKGRCEEDETTECPYVRCSFLLHPVCGSDGKTYSNECLFDAANCRKDKSIAHHGSCQDER